METEPTTPQYPDLEKFSGMSVEDKVRVFTSLPISAQKLLVGTSAFGATVQPEMAKTVSRMKPGEYEEATGVLTETEYFEITPDGRLKIADPMKDFINGDLRKIHEQQKKQAK